MKIAVAGTGYVGLSNAVLLAQHNPVVAVAIVKAKIAHINPKQSPVVGAEILQFLSRKHLQLTSTTHSVAAYRDDDFVIVATPTRNYPNSNYFNTSSVETEIA